MDPLLLTKIVTRLVMPPGILVLLLLLSLLLWRALPRLARLMALGAGLGLYLSSLPLVVLLLANGIEIHQATTPTEVSQAEAQAIVVLGGGRRGYAPEHGAPTVSEHALERLRYGALLQRATRLPLAVSGGSVLGGGPSEADLMTEVLERDFGAVVRWREDRSRNTEQNARATWQLLEPEGIRRIALVSHAAHLYRAVEMFQDQGFEVVPAPTVFWGKPEPLDPVFGDFLPSASAMLRVRVLLHEWVGRIWYRLRRG